MSVQQNLHSLRNDEINISKSCKRTVLDDRRREIIINEAPSKILYFHSR